MRRRNITTAKARELAAYLGRSDIFERWLDVTFRDREDFTALRYGVQWVVGQTGVGVHSIEALEMREGRFGMFIVNELNGSFAAHTYRREVSS